MNDYIQIGTIVASRGWKGEMILVHELGNQLSRENIAVLFIEKNKNNFIPYFIEAIQQKKASEALLKLENINSKESVHTLLKKKVYLEQKRFRSIIQPDSPLYYLGFTIFDKKEKKIGEIAELIQMPEQLVARVLENENELLIPLSAQTIDKIDKRKKLIYVTLPDGLTDIYRQ